MKYQDDASKKTVNGFYVGIKEGGSLLDAADPTNDSYDHLEERFGSVLQDAVDDNPTPLEERGN